MADKSSEDLWTVVISGSRYYIGVVRDDTEDGWVVMRPCYEITSHLIPTGRDNTGRPIMSKNISAEPVLLCFDESSIRLQCTGVIPHESMKPGDRARYKRLADTAASMALKARAADSGLSTAGRKKPGA